MTQVKVQFGVHEDARRIVLDAISTNVHVPAMSNRQRSHLAGELVEALRDAGLLAQSVEQHYSAVQVARLLSRCPKYVGIEARKGAFGKVVLDDGGWLIPASGVQRWLDRRVFGATNEKEAA